MAQVATMNQAQLQILDMLSFIKTPEALRDLNKVISDYFVPHCSIALLKSPRPSLPLKRAPPLISVFSPQGRRGKPPYSVLGTAAL